MLEQKWIQAQGKGGDKVAESLLEPFLFIATVAMPAPFEEW